MYVWWSGSLFRCVQMLIHDFVHISTDPRGVQKKDWDLLGLELQATVNHPV